MGYDALATDIQVQTFPPKSLPTFLGQSLEYTEVRGSK